LKNKFGKFIQRLQNG